MSPELDAVKHSQLQRGPLKHCRKITDGVGRTATHPTGLSYHWGCKIETLSLCLSYICSIIILTANFLFRQPSLFLSPLSIYYLLFSPLSSSPFTHETIKQQSLFLCIRSLHVSIISKWAPASLLLRRSACCGEAAQLTRVKSDE